MYERWTVSWLVDLSVKFGNGCIREILVVDLMQEDITDQLVNESKKDEMFWLAFQSGGWGRVIIDSAQRFDAVSLFVYRRQ